MAVAQDRSELLECWSAKRVVEKVPGTSVKQWRAWIPELVAKGVIVKRGKTWLGRWSQIERELLAAGEA